jgi:hypothetical protein
LSILSAFENSAIPVSIFEGAHQNGRKPEGAQDAHDRRLLSIFDKHRRPVGSGGPSNDCDDG